VAGVQSRLAYQMYVAAWASLDWLFPPNCGGCGGSGSRWCPDCHSSTQVLQSPMCSICGAPLDRSSEAGLCALCKSAPPACTAIRSWAIYSGPIRNAIHRLKYDGDMALAERIARPLIDVLATVQWEMDAVVPVAISRSRQAQRGYNQAGLLARPLALSAGLPFQPKWLNKVRDTSTQVGLSAVERRANVSGAFSAQSEAAGLRILVVDDVTTSGATLNECAAALLCAGAKEVYGLTLARAEKAYRP
jgi:competence protein ComFC